MKTIKVMLKVIAAMAVVITTCLAQGYMNVSNDDAHPVIKAEFVPEKAEAPFTSPGNKPAGSSNTDNITLVDLPGGTYEVGDNQPVLKKLTDVAAQLNGANVLGNVIYELNATYNGTTGETFPVVFNQFATTGGNWTVTIRVKSGVTTRTTSGNTANPLITLDGADNITFDGRAGGTGSTIAWNISNTNTGGIAMNLLNDAQTNTIRYCDLIAVNPASGVVVFGSTTGNQGNDNNIIAW
jgi:roadblock/LC7 domain-containing protein